MLTINIILVILAIILVIVVAMTILINWVTAGVGALVAVFIIGLLKKMFLVRKK
jgi:uncharacterized membrane protein